MRTVQEILNSMVEDISMHVRDYQEEGQRKTIIRVIIEQHLQEYDEIMGV